MFECWNCKATYQNHHQYNIGGALICSNCVDQVSFICERCGNRRLEINRSEGNPEICSYCEK